MKSVRTIIQECLTLLDESLDVERQVYNSPEEGFYIDVDVDDPDTGTVVYMDYEFPIIKKLKAGGVEYLVGSAGTGVTIRGDKHGAFSKVKNAIMNGLVNPTPTNKKDKDVTVTRDIPKTVIVNTLQGPKEYQYIPPGEVDDFVTNLYQKYGAGYKDILKKYVTDRPNGNRDNPYIHVNQTVRQNIFTHKLGSKGNAVNRKT